jgi:hypothetical protein
LQAANPAHASKHASKLSVRMKDNGIAEFGVELQKIVNLMLLVELV